MRASAKRKPIQKLARRKARHIGRKPETQSIVVKATPPTIAENIEKVLIEGNLAPLGAEDRVKYYNAVCQSLGLNPLTKPFAYISLNSKIVLYALRDCTDQLRRIHGISVVASKRFTEDGLAVVEVQVMNKEGRQDTGTGAVTVFNLKGEALANAIMKAETKAKRRATLSICGLGMLDEAELDTMRGNYKMLTPGGRIIDEQDQTNPHEQKYLEREKEAISKLTPAQREVVERKIAEAQTPKPSNLHYELTPSGSWFIDGPEEIKKANRDLLAPLYVHPTGIMATDAQLGRLISQFEQRKVPFQDVTPREPGE